MCMANSVKSLKSHLKQSPLFAASMEAALVVCLSFLLAAEMSLDPVSVLLVNSVHALFSDMVSCAAFFLLRGVAICLTHCWSVLVHSALFPKGLCVSCVFSGGSAVAELQIKGLGLPLSSSS